MHRWTRYAGAAGVMAGGLGLLGCGQSKIEECNALVNALKPGIEDIHSRTSSIASKIASKPEALSEFSGLADAADKVAEEGSKIEVRSAELQKLSAEYQKVMKDFAAAARQVSAAKPSEAGKMNSAADTLEKIGKEEEKLVEDINKYCQAP